MSAEPPTGASLSLAEQLVQRSGLARLIAIGVVKRACTRIGVAPEALVPYDVPRVIDAMEPLLSVYLPPTECAARIAELRRLVR